MRLDGNHPGGEGIVSRPRAKEVAVGSKQGTSGDHRLPVLPFPIADPIASLPATAQKILSAAQRLLAEGGYREITLEKVAAAAGVNKASIRYNFGNKAGLLAALVDALMHGEFARMARTVPALSHGERLEAAIEAKRRMVNSTQAFRGFFELLPHAMREPELRRRIAALYPWWCEQNLTWLDLQAGAGDELLEGLGRLMSAVVDGLSVQAGLDPEFDTGKALRALEFLIAAAMPALEERAAAASAENI
jgi:AcrR family transcriptional regulator